MIETENLLLRDYTGEDVEELFVILSDPVTMSFWPSPLTRDEARAWIARSIESIQEHGFGRYAVTLKRDKRMIGDCGILRIEKAGELVNDLGYIIHHPYWRKGYAVEAARAVVGHAFDRLNLDVIHANMPRDHDSSRKVAERIGMKRVGEFINERNECVRTLLYAIGRTTR
jgi:[ribosomal protein S5]-alanine N-acetyltransferase